MDRLCRNVVVKLIIVFIALFFHQVTQAAEPRKIALIPFEIFSPSNPDQLRQNITEGILKGISSSRNIKIVDQSAVSGMLKGKTLTEELAVSAGAKAGADFIIMGSAFRIGETVNLDCRVIDAKTGKTVNTAYAQGKIDSAGQISADLGARVLSTILGSKKITRIVFKGNRKIEESAIQHTIKSARGKNFSEADLSRDVKSIYRMGYFNDVQADIDESPEGVVITFIVEEKPLISQIKFRGSDAISTKDLEAVISTKPKQFVDNDKLRNDAEKIRDLYVNKAYLNAEVRYESEKREKDITVTFNITENDRVYIKSISFEGNQAFSDKQLKKLMEMNEKGLFSVFTDSGLLKKDKLKEDANRINAFYMNNGYINAKVGEPEITNDKKWIYIKITITEGKRFKVGKVNIQGDNLSVTREQLFKNLKVTNKDFYDRESIIKDLDYLTQAANDEGFAYAEITPNVVPDDKSQKVDIAYTISKGDIVYFNRIEITGNSKTRDKVIRRQLSLVEGELYSRSKLKDSYAKLNRLRYFEEVDFQTEKGPEKDLMDVNVKVKEKPTGMFSIGAGYSALDRAVLSGQVSQQNLFGRGQTLGLNGQLGANSRNYDLFFIEPWLFDIPLYSKYDLWNNYRSYDTYDLYSVGFGATFGYPLFERVVGYIGYRLASNNVTDISPYASSYVRDEQGIITSSGVTLSVSRDTTDDNMFPTKGTKHTISVEFTGGPLQGDTDFTKYLLTSTYFHPLPLDTVFGVRGRIGFLDGRGDKPIPVYDRFYLGGINSLRGLRNVGPTDPATGDVIGGTTMFNGNVEYIFPLVKSAGMKGLVFYDIGNAWDSGYHLDDLRQTAGVGVRWYSPIGPLRLEWGYVLDRRSGEAPSRFEFTIGFFM